MGNPELVVLLDSDGGAAGTLDKSLVHHGDTPLHLAFSCYVFDTDNRLLLSQRALSKSTFPGLWTNSVCGHPGPDESVTAAAMRRCLDELGLQITDPRLILPTFQVEDTRWLPWAEVVRDAQSGALALSPWCLMQIDLLSELGPVPKDWPTGAGQLLPAALRVA